MNIKKTFLLLVGICFLMMGITQAAEQADFNNYKGVTIPRAAVYVYSSTDRDKVKNITAPPIASFSDPKYNGQVIDSQHIHRYFSSTNKSADDKRKIRLESPLYVDNFTDYNGKKHKFYYKIVIAGYDITELKPIEENLETTEFYTKEQDRAITQAHESRHFEDLSNFPFLIINPDDFRLIMQSSANISDKNVKERAQKLFDNIRKKRAANMITLEARATNDEMAKAEKLGVLKSFKDIDTWINHRSRTHIIDSTLMAQNETTFTYNGQKIKIGKDGKFTTYGNAYEKCYETLMCDNAELSSHELSHIKAIALFMAHYHKYKYYEKNVVAPKGSARVNITDLNSQNQDWQKEPDLIALIKEAETMIQRNEPLGSPSVNNLLMLMDAHDVNTQTDINTEISISCCGNDGIIDPEYEKEYRKARNAFIATACTHIFKEKHLEVTYYPYMITHSIQFFNSIHITDNVLRHITHDFQDYQYTYVDRLNEVATESFKPIEEQCTEQLMRQDAPISKIRKIVEERAKAHWNANKKNFILQASKPLRDLLTKEAKLPPYIRMVPTP